STGLFWKSCGSCSELGQHASEDLRPEVLLVTVTVGAALKGADLAVEALDEAQRDLVILMTIRLHAIPVSLGHSGELPEGFEPLPLQGILPGDRRLEISPEPCYPALPKPTRSLVGHRLASGRVTVMDASVEQPYDALIRSGARRLTGYQRRLFQAEVAL